MIYVSAGHHPTKKGAEFDGFTEHDEALVWVDIILANLGDRGIKVPTGVLKDKVDFINRSEATIAIEIHFNSAVDRQGNRVGQGSETLYYPGSKKGLLLAKSVQTILAEYFLPDRGVKEGWYKMDKTKGADFFLAKTKCPSVILEPEFIHRKEIIQNKRGNVCKDLAEKLIEIESKF